MKIKQAIKVLACGLTALGCLLTTSGADAQRVGIVNIVKVWGYGRLPQQSEWQDVYESDTVVFNQGLRTPDGGAMQLEFDDQTQLRLGANSTLVVDRFVYDPATSAGDMAVSLTKGVFRFVSGQLKKEGVSVRTPVAIIGIQGTDFYVEVLDDGTTYVEVIEGQVTVTPIGGGQPVSLTRAQTAVVSATNQGSTGPGRAVTRDPGLEDGGGSGGFGGAAGDSGGSDSGGGGE